jgi:phenylacetate-CoA ligase
MSFTIAEIIRAARTGSPFYKALYSHLPEGEIALETLPVIDQAQFWAANELTHNRVLTGPMMDGVVYKSGGTTGQPKFSVFSRDEWKEFTEAFGWGMNQGGLGKGQRVGNLFYAGELYASFLFITASVAAAPEPALMLPISGATQVSEIAKILFDLKADVLAGAPTTILALAAYLENERISLPSVRKILFGGESAYPEQRSYLQKIFQHADIRSIGYASVDAGLLGYADLSCGPGEHRCFDGHSIVEIVDESTGEVIHETETPGRILITNLTRTLMPIIRYPAGDRGVWKEVQGTPYRKFQLLGRAEEGARVGPATLYFEDMVEALQGFSSELSIQNLQLLIDHTELRDRLTLRIAVSAPAEAAKESERVVRQLLSQRPMVQELVDKNLIHRPQVEFVASSELLTNPRTGKVRRVIDRR